MKRLFILSILLFPLLLRAQNYTPGKWSASIQIDVLPYSVDFSNTALGGRVGYRLTPRLWLQTGLSVSNLRSIKYPTYPPPQVLEGYFEGYSGNLSTPQYRPGWFVPLTLRYAFAKPYRRFQPYVLLGVHFYLGSLQNNMYRYENGLFQEIAEGAVHYNRSGLGAATGGGLRLRVVHRFWLSGEITLNYGHQKNRYWQPVLSTTTSYSFDRTFFTGGGSIGLTYEFK